MEARDSQAALKLLHPEFRAQGELDERWARQTMFLMFQRYAQIRIVALSHSTRTEPPPSMTGFTEAQVIVAGAQDLIPERASPYAVRLEWRRDGDDWRLFDLRWE